MKFPPVGMGPPETPISGLTFVKALSPALPAPTGGSCSPIQSEPIREQQALQVDWQQLPTMDMQGLVLGRDYWKALRQIKSKLMKLY